MTLFAPAIDAYDLLEHGESGDFVGPDQRMTRKLTSEDVDAIREAAALGIPPYRIWKTAYEDVCSYHTVRRVANREHYKELP